MEITIPTPKAPGKHMSGIIICTVSCALKLHHVVVIVWWNIIISLEYIDTTEMSNNSITKVIITLFAMFLLPL